MPKARKFKGYGVVTQQGRFLWQYSRPEEGETRTAYERHNPQLEGYPDSYKVVKISLTLEPVN